jgi:PAS domain S-box-containing protein
MPDFSENLFRLAVESAPNSMILVGEDGKILMVNSQTEKMFGYKRAELIGQTIETLIPARYRDKHVAYRLEFFQDPKTRAMGAGRNLFGLHKNGTDIPVEIGLNPIVTKEGQFVLASIIDITQRRIMEKKLAHSEVLAAIGSMMTVVAHEIRNPLGSIVMAAKALARGELSTEDHAQVMSTLIGESERLARTLADFLQFAKPRQLKMEMGNLNDTIHEVLTAVKSDLSSVAGVVIEETLHKKLPDLNFDEDQMRQVLWNIIRNALQALNGRGKLRISTEARDREVAIHIQDTGPGIAQDHLEKIFVPFFTTKTQGTGLGLPTSRNIVLAHGGDIRVQSEPGKGSCFSIILPLPY